VFGPFVKPNRDLHGFDTADVNDDGLLDVYCTVGTSHQTTTTKSNFLWVQDPDGTFTDQALAWHVADPDGRGRDAAFLDVNGDGLPDLFVFNAERTDGVSAPSRLFINRGGWFGRAVLYGLNGVFWAHRTIVPSLQVTTWGGHQALLAVTTSGPQLWVQHGGAGTAFQHVVPAGWPTILAQGARLEDLDGDGVPDLVAISKGSLGVWGGTSAPSFEASWSTSASGGRSVAVADATGDGLPDLYVTTWSTDISQPNPPDFLFVNGGGQAFAAAGIPETGAGQGASAAVLPYESANAFLVANGPNLLEGPIQVIGPA
jgi:hypothetical protein